MKKINIKGKTYIAGLKWYSFDDKESAKEKLQELEYGGILRYKEKDLWMVYGSEEPAKGLILASGFLHLPSGYYYMNLEDGRKWILLKGTDGGIVYEDVVEDFKTAEEEHHELFVGFYDASGKIKREEISISDGRNFKSFGSGQISTKHFIALGISLLVIAGGLFMLLGGGKEKPRQQTIPPPQAIQVEEVPIQEEVIPSMPAVGRLNIKECFDRFYKEGKCEVSVSGDREEVSTSCQDALKVLQRLSARGALIWGQNQHVGEYSMYSFSLSGDFLMKELEYLSQVDFVQGEMRIEGDIFEPQVVISGVLACK